MPIYEFYCPACNRIFSFRSAAVNTTARPMCPRCKRKKLQRRISSFAVTGKASEAGDGDELPIDESKMGQAMEAMAGEVEQMNEDDPRQAANLMRKLSRMTGFEYGENMEEALSRMEAGEDPEAIEQEMGELLDDDEPFLAGGKKRSRRAPPAVDEDLYDL